jgi:putative membrane protein
MKAFRFPPQGNIKIVAKNPGKISTLQQKTWNFEALKLQTKTGLMTTEILLRYIHFISIFAIVGTLVSEHLLLKPELSRAEIARLSRIDAIYGLAALTLLTVGLTMWLGGVTKPSVYYTKNWIFHTKITCFALIGILSIYPTIFFIKNRKGHAAEIVAVPRSIFWMLRLELTLLVIIPLLAGLMARGVGFFG